MPAFLALSTAVANGFSSRGARKMKSTPLRDHAVDIGDLLGGGAGGVGIDELIAPLGGLVLHARRLGETPRVVAFGLRETDLVVILFLERRDLAEGGSERERRAHANGPD